MSMRSSVKAAIGLAIVLGTSAVGVWQAGCSSSGDSPSAVPANGGGAPGSSSNGTGQVSIALTLAGGDVINGVTWTLENSSGAIIPLGTANPGTVNTSNSLAINFQIGGIPAGTGDQITLSATTTQGETCTGTAAGITITAHATASVAVQMLCTAPAPDAGNLSVTGTTSYCGTWTSLATGATGSEVFVGETITLNAAATGDNPSNLGYTWTMSNPIGAFGATVGRRGRAGAGRGRRPVRSDAVHVHRAGHDHDYPGGRRRLARRGNRARPNLEHGDDDRDLRSRSEPTRSPRPGSSSRGPTGRTVSRATSPSRAPSRRPPPPAGANPCPTITINGGAPVQMNLRAAATTSLALRSVNTPPAKPALFPISSCEYPLPAGATSAVVAGQSLPLPKANPTKIVVIGDTGCRLQNGNGTQSCNDPNPNGTDTPYPFAAIAALAAAQNPDLVLHVGDYAYRDNPCPAGQGYNCGGSPWGFGWDTWQADLFAPGAPLLAAAPWIMTRGNHEQCNRAGQGWYRFLDTQPVRHHGRSHLRQPGGRRHRDGRQLEQPVPGQHQREHADRRLRYRECQAAVAVAVAADGPRFACFSRRTRAS